MSRFLAYVDAVPGRPYPLVPTLQELSRRGHHVTVKAGVDDIERLRSAGLHAAPLAPPIERFEPDDWKASTRFGALMSGLRRFGERAGAQAADLAETIDSEQPDALFIDEGSWGAAAAAERCRAIGLRAGAQRIAEAFGGAGGPSAAADALEQLAPAHAGAAHESPGRGR